MLIHYPDGSYAEGAIHRLQGNTLRALIAGVDHAVEYTLIQNGWTSNRGVVVTFEFTVGRGLDLLQVMPAIAGELPAIAAELPAECAAGGDCALRRMPGSGSDLVQ